MTDKNEYVRRNLLVCQAIGVQSGLNAIKTMVEGMENSLILPKELAPRIDSELVRFWGICEELARHRDECEHDKASGE